MDFGQAFEMRRGSMTGAQQSGLQSAYASSFLWPWSSYQGHHAGSTAPDLEKMYGLGHMSAYSGIMERASANVGIDIPGNMGIGMHHHHHHHHGSAAAMAAAVSCKAVAAMNGMACMDVMQENSIHSGMASSAAVAAAAAAASYRQQFPQMAASLEPPFKGYKCKICHHLCFSRQDLLMHNNSLHKADPRPFRCEQCGRQFATTAYLSQHRRIHTGLKPYACKFCDKSFTQLSHVQQHERIHTGEKPYRCWTCNKMFTQMSNLQSHQRQHLKEKPYRCESCYMCYDTREELETHIQAKHSTNKYSKVLVCHVCGKNYNSETYLNKHLAKHNEFSNNISATENASTDTSSLGQAHSSPSLPLRGFRLSSEKSVNANGTATTLPAHCDYSNNQNAGLQCGLGEDHSAVDNKDSIFHLNRESMTDAANTAVHGLRKGLNGFSGLNSLLGANGAVVASMMASVSSDGHTGSNLSGVISSDKLQPSICAPVLSSMSAASHANHSHNVSAAAAAISFHDANAMAAAASYEMGGLFGGFPPALAAYSRY